MVAADADTGKIGSILTSSRLGTLRILWVAIALLLARAKVILGLSAASLYRVLLFVLDCSSEHWWCAVTDGRWRMATARFCCLIY